MPKPARVTNSPRDISPELMKLAEFRMSGEMQAAAFHPVCPNVMRARTGT
jgi:hypothetical protein